MREKEFGGGVKVQDPADVREPLPAATQSCSGGVDRAVLAESRLIYVAPAEGHSGVGDYASDFSREITPFFKELVEYRVECAPQETVRDLARNVRRIRALVATARREGPTLVHFEQSGASLAPFWGALLSRDVPVTATIHDAPQPVWWPLASRSITRRRLVHHGVHYPLRFATDALQRRMCKGRTVLALTTIGARETRTRMPGADVRDSRIFIPDRPPMPDLHDRPLAVGFFGYAYKAKGFDIIGELREHLDDDIEIVVAGRGTESIPSQRGVTVLGEVNGVDEHRFFERIRFLMVPYSKTNLYGRVYAASSAITRSYAYGTPVICSLSGALPEIVSEGGALGVGGSTAEFAMQANTAVRSDDTLRRLAAEVAVLRSARTVAECAVPFLSVWSEIASGATW